MWVGALASSALVLNLAGGGAARGKNRKNGNRNLPGYMA